MRIGRWWILSDKNVRQLHDRIKTLTQDKKRLDDKLDAANKEVKELNERLGKATVQQAGEQSSAGGGEETVSSG